MAMTDLTAPIPTDSREKLYADLSPSALAPLWSCLETLVPRAPMSECVPALWNYDDVRPLLLRAGALISAEEAIRRVLILENPGLPGCACITPTLYAGLQLILPGEVAPAHRHTQSAFRFIIEGEGAFTTVRGERLPMSPGDLVLTPNFEWHDHGHDGCAPVIWLDGLDIPLIRSLQAGFAENSSSAQQNADLPTGYNAATWGAGLRPPYAAQQHKRVERFIYHYREWRDGLKLLSARGDRDPAGLYTLEFSNPVDGGSILPTMSAFCQLLRAGEYTRWQQRTDGLVYHVVEGAGVVEIGDVFRSSIAIRDTFVVPPWMKFRLLAEQDLVLFSYSDRATQERLDLWRERVEKSESI